MIEAALRLSTRRTLSWLGSAAFVAVLVVGLARFPGAGGVSGERRWLVAQEAGIEDPSDDDLKKFDQKRRGKKLSNEAGSR